MAFIEQAASTGLLKIRNESLLELVILKEVFITERSLISGRLVNHNPPTLLIFSIPDKLLRLLHSLISNFPFVEAVGVSGSLSKGYYDTDSDIDFFVITKHNKLWICRTLLMVYKKTFLLNSRKYFCVNYFISSQQLEIEEKNRFTATELKTLIPMQGKDYFEQFYKCNNWVTNYFSKFNSNCNQIPTIKKPLLTKSIEFVLDNGFGNTIDLFFKSITLRKWKAKFDYLSEEDFKIALKSTKNISKHHPSNFQKKVILSLNSKLEEVQKKFNLVLQKEHA